MHILQRTEALALRGYEEKSRVADPILADEGPTVVVLSLTPSSLVSTSFVSTLLFRAIRLLLCSNG